MPNWSCPKCNTENRPEGKYCRACGEARPAASRPPAAASVSVGSPAGSLSVLDELKSDLGNTFKQSRASLDQFAAGLPKLSELKVEMPDLNAVLKKEAAFERVTTRDLKVQARPRQQLNFALAHCTIPLIPTLEIRNSSLEPAQDVLIKAWVATDYGEPWQKTVPTIPAQKSHLEHDIIVPLTKARLQEVREAEKANLRIDVFTEGALQVSETYPLEVLAYNEWYYHPDLPQLMACFVQPNSEAIEKIISLVRDRLRREYRDTSLDGYQSGDPKKIKTMLEALYLTLQKDLQLSYINPPPSFELPEILPEGGHTMSQKVFFPEQILKHRRGTCLDLALMCAACVERMGLNPLCFLIRGHAFLGAWLEEKASAAPVITDHNTVLMRISEGSWLPMNSTTFAMTPPKKFKDCLEAGRGWLSDSERFMCAVDVASARVHGFKPIPPLVDSGHD